MNKVKACIFDLDGVIVDTAKYHYLAWKQLAQELGFDFSKKDNERLKGVSRMASLDILLEIGGKALDTGTKVTLANRKNRWYVDYISNMSEDEIFPGVKDFIEKLRQNGIKVALGSASKNAMIILDNLKLTGYFDTIVDGNKVTRAKPDPEVFLLAAMEMRIAPGNCVVFEDAQAGIEAAKNAGMYCIGIGSELQLKGADTIIPGFVGIDIEIINRHCA